MSTNNNDEDFNIKNGIIFLSGLLGGGFLGYNIYRFINKIDNINKEDKVKEFEQIIEEINIESDVEKKLILIKKKIIAQSYIDSYGAILVLFSEFEKFFINIFNKKLVNKTLPKNFHKKIIILEKNQIISSIESLLIRENILPIRNSLVHGRYNEVNQDNIIACYYVINDLILKYKYIL